jgi:signal transduction histidine kinase
MYRIAQEAVNSALRHAHTACIRGELAAEQTRLSPRVDDEVLAFVCRQTLPT